MLLVWFSCSPTSAYHFSHQFFALAVILYYPDMDFETIPLFNSLIIILFSRPVSFLQTHPQDIPPSFLFNTEKHNSHDQWIPLLQIHSALTLSLSLLNSSSTPKLILFHTLSEHLQLSPLNSPSLMAASPPIIVDVHHLFRGLVYTLYIYHFFHILVYGPNKSTQSIILRILFVSITQNIPPALSLHRSCQPLFLKLHRQDNST